MRSRKPAEERRAEIVAAAIELADRVGPDRLTTATIAQAVGVSQAALFRHFPTKQAIWEAIVAWLGDRLEARWTSAVAEGGPAAGRLSSIVRRHLELVRSVPAIPSIVFSRELHSRNETLRRGLYGVMGRFHGHLVGIVEDGRRRGEFRADLDAADAAFLVIGLVQGLVIRWSLSGRSIDLVGEGERMLTLLLRSFEAEIRT